MSAISSTCRFAGVRLPKKSTNCSEKESKRDRKEQDAAIDRKNQLYLLFIPTPIPLEYLPYDQTRAAVGILRVIPDPHKLDIEPPLFQFIPDLLLVEVLVEPERDYVRPDLLYWAEHVVQVAEHRVVNNCKGCDHVDPLLLGYDGFWLVGDVCVPGDDHVQLVPELLRLLEIVDMPRVEDIERAGRDNLFHPITSISVGFPFARKHRQFTPV